MITRDDVLKVGVYLKALPLTENQIAYCQVNYDRKADEDPTGNPDVWIEQLIDEAEDLDEVNQQIDGMIGSLREAIKSEYAYGENSSGEWILAQQLPVRDEDGDLYTLYMVQSAVTQFLMWDSEDDGQFNQVGVYLVGANCTTNWDGDYWAIQEFNEIEYKGIQYPTRILNVTIDEYDDDWEHCYQIAPESLCEALEDDREDEDSEFYDEAIGVDNQIYHYVEDCIFYETGEYIAKHGLDLPMTLIGEEVHRWEHDEDRIIKP